ncbi:MAG: hypothetical protein FJ404_01595 [Verrucomicrobia bacterium]|nr:hypothetical protein [Verrucomicrobiota bacterium]
MRVAMHRTPRNRNEECGPSPGKPDPERPTPSSWRLTVSWVCAWILSSVGVAAFTPKTVLSTEHVDFKILFDPTERKLSGIVLRDEDARTNYTSDQALLLVKEAARLQLPAGTPFGQEGDPLWVLPQSQDPNLILLGISAEDIPPNVFDGRLELRLVRVEGPGHFFAWQAESLGSLDVRFNSSDGLTLEDRTRPIAGSHEHLNWGFTKPGVYRLHFEAFGTRLQDRQELQTLPTAFEVHVHPLPALSPFASWQIRHWPRTAPESGPDQDPDGDGLPNLLEYAFGTDPTRPSKPESIEIRLSSGEPREIELMWTRNAEATDLEWSLESRSALVEKPESVPVQPRVVAPHPTLERVAVNLALGILPMRQQFYRLRAQLKS